MSKRITVDFSQKGPNVQRWTADNRCPICDGHQYLAHGVGERCHGFASGGGRFAHCSREEYAGSLEVTEWGTYQHDLKQPCRCGINHRVGPVEEIYPYTSNGTTSYEVVRHKPKNFRPRREDSEGHWHGNLDGVERILYNRPRLLDTPLDEWVVYCEGEKDTNTCTSHGLTATTHAGGANGWRAEFADDLRGRKLVILPHNDDDGQEMVARMLPDLYQVSRLRVLTLPGLAEHGDVTDWVASGGTKEKLLELIDQCLDQPRPKVIPAGQWILRAPAEVPAVWGEGQKVLWSRGEPLLLVGPQGVGKTTLMQQLALRRSGAVTTTLFQLPVEVSRGRGLYIAADRPHQVRRSFARMVDEKDFATLNDKLLIWAGRLPFNLTTHPEKFMPFIAQFDVDTVYIDSLKDVVADLIHDEGGLAIKQAFSEIVDAGIELVASHHQRKKQADNAKPKELDDVYGSVWITAGTGSVVLLWGKAGDAVVELSHLKQSAEQFHDAKVLHDQAAGTFVLLDQPDLQIVLKKVKEITVKQWAVQLFGKTEDKLTANEVEKARRSLESKVKAGEAKKVERRRAQGGKPETVYSLLQAPK